MRGRIQRHVLAKYACPCHATLMFISKLSFLDVHKTGHGALAQQLAISVLTIGVK